MYKTEVAKICQNTDKHFNINKSIKFYSFNFNLFGRGV